MKEKGKTTVTIDADAHRAARVHCAEKGIHLGTFVTDLILKALGKGKPQK